MSTSLRFPVYIPTKGRPSTQLTASRLLPLGVTPHLVVQADEVDAYTEANPGCIVLAWPQSYLDNYERTPELDPHPTTGAAHNFAWDHARDAGYSHHWIMDDNLRSFWHRQAGGKFQGDPPAKVFVWHEELATRYANLAGLSLGQGNTFSAAPFTLNTRLYCAVLYRNDLWESGIRWRRGLNDDTIVSLDILKTGYWCTAESHMLGIMKTGTSRTARLPGGMTDFYADGGFLRKAAEAVRVHPDCVKVIQRFGRIHHQIDYSQFTQKLIPVEQPVRETTP